MASLSKRNTDAGVRYDVVYRCRGCTRHPEPGQHRKTFTTHKDAQRFARSVEVDLDRGAYVDTSTRVTVADYARSWVEARPQRPTTRARQTSILTHHVEATPLGARRVVDVRPTEVQAWATGRAAVLAPSTARSVLSLLRSVFAGAVADRIIAASPVVGITLPRTSSDPLVPLSVEQVRDLADAMPERERAMIVVQAGLGLRIAELFALRVEDVEWLRRTVRVEHQLDARGNRRPPKTPKSRRAIPAPTVVLDALAAHVAAFPPAADGTLFTARTGRPYCQQSYGATLARAVQRAGLPDGTTSHALRHHYASVLIARGVDVLTVADLLGHENADLVLSTYGHLTPDAHDRARAALEAAWNPNTDAPAQPSAATATRYQEGAQS